MATISTTAEMISTDAVAGIQACAATLMGTAVVALRPNGEPLAPLTAVGPFYRAMAAYPAGMEFLTATAFHAARAAIKRRLPATAQQSGFSLVAFPLPSPNGGAALVAFTTSGVRPEMRAALAADLGLPPGALPGESEELNPSHVSATLRLLEQTLPLATVSRVAADPEARRDRIRSSAIKALFKAEDEAEVLRIVSETLAGLLHMDRAIPFVMGNTGWEPQLGVAYWEDTQAGPPALHLEGEHSATLQDGGMVTLPVPNRPKAGRVLVPLLFVTNREKVLLGVVALETVHTIGDKNGADSQLALEIGRLTALALHNARVATLDRTLARTLQVTLQSHFDREIFPDLIVEEFYQAAAQDSLVGGDFYDVFALPDGRVAVLVGDVAGRGLDSAIHTTLARYTLRAYALLTSDPAEILRLSNEALARFREFRDFLTVALVILDPAAGQLQYASAGHPPTFLFRRRADAIGSLDSTGTLLGMMPGLTWESHTHKWSPGDMLLLYTDGISEAHATGSVDMFETTRIRDIFAAHCRAAPRDVINAIFNAASDFSQGAMHDDCALLVVTQAETR